jgi:CHAT domain-containing protein
VKRAATVAVLLLLHGGGDAWSATLREDAAADIALIRGLKTLSGVQLSIAYPINHSLAYDFFVPCLDYADSVTAKAAQSAILRDVEGDTRNAVIDIYGKLDYHAAYKGRDNLRERALDEAVDLLGTRIDEQSSGRNLGYLCALTTRFERVETDFVAAARDFGDAYASFGGRDAIFDLPLMRALTSAQFWPADAARQHIAATGEQRATLLAGVDPLRSAFLYAYASLAHPDVREFLRLADLAIRTSPADRLALEIVVFTRMSEMIDPDAAVQLELLRDVFSRPLPTRRAAEMLPVDHLDRVTRAATENYINLPSEHYTPQEYDAALRIMDGADLIRSEVRAMEEQLLFDPQANTWSKRFLFQNYQTQDYRRMVGRYRVDLMRQMQVARNAPADLDRYLTDSILNSAGGMSRMLMQAYNPGYRDVWKYGKTEDLARALALYQSTGDERFFDLALFAVQTTFLNLTDLSLRWQKLRLTARSRQEEQLVTGAQRLLFGFEPEMMQLLDYIRSVQVDDQPLSRAHLTEIHRRYDTAAKPFNGRHATLQEMQRRLPQADGILAASAPRLQTIRDAIRPDEAVIYIARVDDDYLRFVITRQKVRVVHTRDSEERVRGLVARMVDNLTPDTNGRYAEFDSVTAHALYDLTIAPLENDLQQVNRLVWIGPDALAGLSPEVFVDDSGSLLFERFNVTLNSSLTDLVESRGTPRVRRDEALRVLAVAAPQSSASDIACLTAGDCPAPVEGRRFRGAGTDSGKITLAPLPETAAEVLALSRALAPADPELLLGPEARVGNVVELASRNAWDLLAFATHGVPGDRLEPVGLTEPALLLGFPEDGRASFMSTSEIAALRLGGGPVVVLSACDTARASNGSIYFDSLSGFYQAFRLAGASGVLATQWEVSSDAAQRLIPDFVSRVRQGDTFADALHDAKARLRDESPEALRHPGYWMPFAFLGDGGAGF